MLVGYPFPEGYPKMRLTVRGIEALEPKREAAGNSRQPYDGPLILLVQPGTWQQDVGGALPPQRSPAQVYDRPLSRLRAR